MSDSKLSGVPSPHSELVARARHYADRKDHISPEASRVILAAFKELEEQLEAAHEEILFLCSDEDDIRKGLREQLEAVEEKVARALYEKAMEERRSCLAGFRQDKRWDDDPYVGPVREGESRPTNWRDAWRDQARWFLDPDAAARLIAANPDSFPKVALAKRPSDGL